jgi:hypothetical protein
MKNPEDIPEMLHEMATVGVSMAVTVTLAWAIAELVYWLLNKNRKKEKKLQGAF